MGAIEDAQKAAQEAVSKAMAQAGNNPAALNNLAAAQAETDAAKAGSAAMDTNGPDFQPIDGVSYDDYVALAVKMQPAGTDNAKILEIAKANGLDEAKWKKVSDGFTKRCTGNPQFARKLGMDVMAAAKG
jgi:hypothetical protein